MLSGRAMKSPLARLVRLLMLVLTFSIAAARPALAQDDEDAGPSVLRDSETEHHRCAHRLQQRFIDCPELFERVAPGVTDLHVSYTFRSP